MYVAISGATDGNINSTFYQDVAPVQRGLLSRNGMFFAESFLKPNRVTDGLSNTLAMGEQSDWGYEQNNPGVQRDIRSSATGGVFSSTCDGGMTPHPKDPVPLAEIRGSNVFAYNITTLRYPINDTWWISVKQAGKSSFGEYNKTIHSPHPGGANVVLADGSVRFLNDDLALDTLRQLGSRKDGLVSTEVP
jgi:prepilin-type processing-associated H-X9-DG protein